MYSNMVYTIYIYTYILEIYFGFYPFPLFIIQQVPCFYTYQSKLARKWLNDFIHKLNF